MVEFFNPLEIATEKKSTIEDHCRQAPCGCRRRIHGYAKQGFMFVSLLTIIVQLLTIIVQLSTVVTQSVDRHCSGCRQVINPRVGSSQFVDRHIELSTAAALLAVYNQILISFLILFQSFWFLFSLWAFCLYIEGHYPYYL